MPISDTTTAEPDTIQPKFWIMISIPVFILNWNDAYFKCTYQIQHDNQQPVLKQVVQNNLPKLDEIWKDKDVVNLHYEISTYRWNKDIPMYSETR